MSESNAPQSEEEILNKLGWFDFRSWGTVSKPAINDEWGSSVVVRLKNGVANDRFKTWSDTLLDLLLKLNQQPASPQFLRLYTLTSDVNKDLFCIQVSWKTTSGAQDFLKASDYQNIRAALENFAMLSDGDIESLALMNEVAHKPFPSFDRAVCVIDEWQLKPSGNARAFERSCWNWLEGLDVNCPKVFWKGFLAHDLEKENHYKVITGYIEGTDTNVITQCRASVTLRHQVALQDAEYFGMTIWEAAIKPSFPYFYRS
jgi:hypothetical protein